MNVIGMNNSTQEQDYIDQLGRILPWHRSFTSLERLLIVLMVSTFVSVVGCALLCLIYPRSPFRRKYYSKNKFNKEQHYSLNTVSRRSLLIVPPPPSYDSITKAEEFPDLKRLYPSPYLHLGRKSSNGTASDSDGVQSGHGSDYPLSTRSSLSNGGALSTISNTYPLAPYAQINVELEIDPTKNLLNIHVTNGEHFSSHPAFDEQAEYFIRVQILNNKLLKKFYEGWKKRRSSLPLNTWKKQQEKATRNLFRTSNDTLICDEHIQFQLKKSDITSTSIRFLLFSTDRTGIQDLMFESLISLNTSMIPKYQQTIEFKAVPQVTFGEILLGISYLPTSERFTININKLRYFCKTEKEKKTDVRLIVTFFHNGRRFFQKKIPFILNGSTTTENEINDTIIQNIPQNNIQSVYIHIELNSKDDSFISPSTILLGEHTRYESNWQKMLEYPRQTHPGWYQLLG